MTTNVINAQYILDYGPGSPAWCLQQEMMWNQQMAQVNAAFYQMAQQMAQQAMQNIQNMQMFNNNMAPVNINQMPVMPACDYSNSPSTPTVSSSYETCPECTNGYNTKNGMRVMDKLNRFRNDAINAMVLEKFVSLMSITNMNSK